MNLNISYNWLKEHIATKKSAADFAKALSQSGPTVDFIHHNEAKFSKVVVGEILEINNHPNADKLHVCKVDIGEKEPLQIVCGAPNIKAGQKVPVVLIGGRVGEMEVKEAKLRGVDSFGMMCSQRELGVGDDHTGIYIMPDYLKVGLPFEKVMPVEDYIFDIEVTSNRPDAMSVIGLAREAAAIMGEKFLYREPKPNLRIASVETGHAPSLKVTVKEPKLCPRYQAIVMTGVKVDVSPLWLQQRLLASGLRPINNLVDITNYILLEFGQPMHVFDYEKLLPHPVPPLVNGRENKAEIIVRLAKSGEKILALDGKTYELGSSNLVIADGKNPAAVAGIMGGELSAVSDGTKTIVLEAATFDPVSIRKTARVLNLHSDSSNLFEKGLNPEGTTPALLRAVELVVELAGGKVASKIFDEKDYKFKAKELTLALEDVRRILGVEIKSARIKEILDNLGFRAAGDKQIKVKVPYWRDRDIEGPHDLIEEIARVYGYHNLPAILPAGEIPVDVAAVSPFQLEDKVKDIIVGLGFSENYNYSFISEKLIKNCGLSVEDHVKISNPLNVDFEYMRTSLVPGILQAIADNENSYKEMSIFELSKVYLNKPNDLPDEITNLCLAVAGRGGEEAFLAAKGALSVLLEKLNIKDFSLAAADGESSRIWQPGSVFSILASEGKESVGRIGIVDREALHLFGIKSDVGIVDIDFEKLAKLAKPSPTYRSLPKFPGIELDLSMEIGDEVLYGNVVETAMSVDPLIREARFLSVFRGKDIPEGKKALAIRVVYRDEEKTLELAEAQKVHDKVVDKLKKEYNVKVR